MKAFLYDETRNDMHHLMAPQISSRYFTELHTQVLILVYNKQWIMIKNYPCVHSVPGS